MNKPSLQTPEISSPANTVSLAELYPLIQEILNDGGEFTLTITGTSMYPFILGGRDRVTLSPIHGRLKKNDLPLYRRKDGSFVLHRIVRVEDDGSYTMCGDHQWTLERGIRQEQLIALATAYVRKGKIITDRNVLYHVYRTVWTWVLPRRYVFFRWNDRLHRLVGRLFQKRRH